jgi:hypothetical protein
MRMRYICFALLINTMILTVCMIQGLVNTPLYAIVGIAVTSFIFGFIVGETFDA